jgi:hypothetical protein
MAPISPETPDFQPLPDHGSPELRIPPYSPEEFPYQYRLPEGREDDPFWHKVAAVVTMTDAVRSGELDEAAVNDNDSAKQWIEEHGLAWWYPGADALRLDVLMAIGGMPHQILSL